MSELEGRFGAPSRVKIYFTDKEHILFKTKQTKTYPQKAFCLWQTLFPSHPASCSWAWVDFWNCFDQQDKSDTGWPWGWGQPVKSSTASAGLSLPRHGALCRHPERYGYPTATEWGRGGPPGGRDAAEAPAVPVPGIRVLPAQTLEWRSLRDESNPIYHLNATSGKPPKSQLHSWAISKFSSHRNWAITNDHCCFKLR